MLTIHSLPELRRPVLLCAFNGWPDAGGSATGALAFISMKWASRRLAEFDPDAVYSYTITRPVTGAASDGERLLHWPELAFWAPNLPHAERDLVLLRGPEPDLLWRRSSQAIAELAQRLHVELILTLGCFLAPVSHARPTPLFARTSDPVLHRGLAQRGFRDTDYQGPTAFTTAVINAARRAAIPAASLWAAAPSYLRGASNPKASATLLSGVESLAQVSLGIEELWAAARDLDQRIDRALQERPDLERLVQSMQEQPEEREEEAGPAPEELPSPQAVLEDLENYLRQLQQDRDGGE